MQIKHVSFLECWQDYGFLPLNEITYIKLGFVESEVWISSADSLIFNTSPKLDGLEQSWVHTSVMICIKV
jgi:hypothetical protein